ncbi:MAG: NAD-dependent epimerase/dehydratase family protein [Rubrobacteraceae bacterium]
MKVLITGATGLLGGAMVDRFLANGVEVRCLVREDSPNARRLSGKETEVFPGDARLPDDLRRAISGVDAAAHVAGIEFAPAVVSAMRGAGVGRLLVVSSTSARSRFEFRSGPKLAMEELVKESGLEWTIVRPAMIYGSELDKNVHKLLRFLDRSPVFPMFGTGENLWQPVYHEDCAKGSFEALVREQAVHRTYDLPGARPLTYDDLVKTAAEAIGKRPRIIHVPLEPVRRGLELAEKFRMPLPIRSEQVLRLREDKAYSYDEARGDLGYEPRSFGEGVALEVERLRRLGLIRG